VTHSHATPCKANPYRLLVWPTSSLFNCRPFHPSRNSPQPSHSAPQLTTPSSPRRPALGLTENRYNGTAQSGRSASGHPAPPRHQDAHARATTSSPVLSPNRRSTNQPAAAILAPSNAAGRPECRNPAKTVSPLHPERTSTMQQRGPHHLLRIGLESRYAKILAPEYSSQTGYKPLTVSPLLKPGLGPRISG